jgi:hypothetical protein
MKPSISTCADSSTQYGSPLPWNDSKLGSQGTVVQNWTAWPSTRNVNRRGSSNRTAA